MDKDYPMGMPGGAPPPGPQPPPAPIVISVEVTLAGATQAAQSQLHQAIKDFAERLTRESETQEISNRDPGVTFPEVTTNSVSRAKASLTSRNRRDREDGLFREGRDIAYLIGEIADLERAAAKVLPPVSEPTRQTIFDLRAGLQAAGIWSADDVIAFDRTVRVRNALVHADFDELNEAEVGAAIDTVDKLKKLIESFE